MKKSFYLICMIAAAVFTGCTAMPDIAPGRDLIRENKAECVLMKNGVVIYQVRGRGISPLLEIYDRHKDLMADAAVVDKVVGKAAAMIAICGKAKHVHGELMCEDAVKILKKHHITSSYTLLVPQILNRKQDGLCPMEMTVQKMDDPAQGVSALRLKVKELQQKK